MRRLHHYSYVLFFIILIGCYKNKHYYMENCRMLDPTEINDVIKKRPISTNLLLAGHYVGKGNNLVLLIRNYFSGSIFREHTDTFEKLTIEIQDYQSGIPIMMDSEKIKSYYYSTGMCRNIPYEGWGVYAKNGSGSITITNLDEDSLIVKFDITMLTIPSSILPSEVHAGKEKKIVSEYILKKISIDDLSCWIGYPCDLEYREVFPNF